jgi:uncharacterized protein YPO0396
MSVTAINSQTPTMGLTHTNGLTPDGLVLYLQSQLGDIDAKIDSFMAKQKLIQAQRKELNAMSTALAGVKVPEDGGTATSMGEIELKNYETARDRLDDAGVELDPDTIDAIDGVYKDSFATPEELKQLQSAIDNTIKDLESSASLDMIQLQSCVSQRNTAISLATNLMSAVGKGEESIAGNIGR